MPQRYLKPLRVVLALFFLAGTAWLFLDLRGQAPPALIDAVLYLQFTPSLVRFTQTAGWAAAGFVFVLVLTLVCGRVFCSTICPLGTLQDLIMRAAQRLRRRRRVPFRYRRPADLLRYGLLLVASAAALGGSMLLAAQLDPFSHFGRILGLLVRPMFVAGNNLAARGLEGLGSFALAPADFALAHWQAVAGPLLVLALLVWMSVRHGRLFCNSLCPVGALLGVLSRVALLRIGIDRQRCNLCAECSLRCKAECIHLKDKRVDFDRCVACFNCIPACPESGIGYRPFWRLMDSAGGSGRAARGARSAPVDKAAEGPQASIGGRSRSASRRTFLRRGAAWLLGFAAVASLCRAKEWPRNKSPTLTPVVKRYPVAPPGAGSIARFTSVCTACQLCVSACPTQVLQPSLLAYGVSGFLQPRMAYEVAYCTYECTRCGEVCPTDAVRPLAVTDKKLAKVGEVHFIKDNCIVVTEKTACGACAEHCPTKAVHMVPYEGGLTIPELETRVCIGCGACEHACPVRPYRAIYVEGEPVHKTAEVPKSDALDVKVPAEFPF